MSVIGSAIAVGVLFVFMIGVSLHRLHQAMEMEWWLWEMSIAYHDAGHDMLWYHTTASPKVDTARENLQSVLDEVESTLLARESELGDSVHQIVGPMLSLKARLFAADFDMEALDSYFSQLDGGIERYKQKYRDDTWRLILAMGVGTLLVTSLFIGILIWRSRWAQRVFADIQVRDLVIEYISEAIVITDEQNTIRYVNAAFTRITQYSEAEVLGKNPSVLSSGQQDKNFYKSLWETLKSHGVWEGEIVNRRKDGTTYTEWLSIHRISGGILGQTIHVAVFTDISRRKAQELQLKEHAQLDPLTKLYNRREFLHRAETRIERKEAFCLIYLDLDNFKRINDEEGHATGDEVLIEVANRMQRVVRANDEACRYGGDEFCLILPGAVTDERLNTIMDTLILALSQPYHIDGQSYRVGCSAGAACYPTEAQSMEALITLSDERMYLMKERHHREQKD